MESALRFRFHHFSEWQIRETASIRDMEYL